MTEHFFGISAILVLGILAQWIAYGFRLPSILFLLITGLLAGPVTGFLNIDELFGNILFPIVSLSVGVILYEGGLSLRFRELPRIGAMVFSLISVGMVVTWMVCTWAAQNILGMDFQLAVLLGAILTVSGPTVVIPLLRDVRAKEPLGALLKWEGILIDPIGALMAVLVLEAILDHSFHAATSSILYGVLYTLVIGCGFGVAGALFLILLLRRFWLPDYLQNPVSLMILITIFSASNYLQPESGLLAATVMGIVITNWESVTVRHIVEFKENLRVLLISSLFIILAARLRFEDIAELDWSAVLFLAVVMLVARPLAVFCSTAFSKLTFKERLFLSWIYPRGIVAAAVSSLFALELSHAGMPEGHLLIPYTFLVIVGTVVLNGLTSGFVADYLGVRQKNPQGLLIVGAHSFARTIARELQRLSYRVLLVDANFNNISDARKEGLPAYHGNVLAEYLLDEVDLDGIGRLLALTSNDNANALAALHFSEVFGRSEVYQLAPSVRPSEKSEQPLHLRGRWLFGPEVNYPKIEELLSEGAEVKTTGLTEQFDYEDYQSMYGESLMPMFLISEDGGFQVFTREKKLNPRPGQKIIALVKEPESSKSTQKA